MTELEFRLKKLFIRNPHVLLSVRDVAEAYDLSIPVARSYFLEDLENEMIFGDTPALIRQQSYYLAQEGLNCLGIEFFGYLQ